MNAKFIEKRDRALRLLADSDIGERNYLPPLYSALWKLGVPLPPPHFLPFKWVALLNGIPAAMGFVGLTLLTQDPERHAFWYCLAIATVIGAISGLIIAHYYKISRMKNRLPAWNSLGASANQERANICK